MQIYKQIQNIENNQKKEWKKRDYKNCMKKQEKQMNVKWKKISPNDKKRILRVLEIYKQTGKTKTQLDKQSRKDVQYDYKVFAINMNREILYNRINKRVDIMIQKGLIDEVKQIFN